jgi:hypothetical protein
MKKAFFINGGIGRVLCALPALEYYVKNTDPDAVIVAEGWLELFLLSPTLKDNVYPVNHKGLFKDKLRDKQLISPEPYRLNAYFNQKANLIQAFDMLINDLIEVPETKPISIFLGKSDEITGYNLVSQIRNQLGKEKVVIFQPFGSTAKLEGNIVIDESGRSFELKDTVRIIEELNKDYAVVVMSSFKIPYEFSSKVAHPEGVNILQWAAIIEAADYFLGCDSMGQHYANALGKKATVVIGATFPENISYPNNPEFNIIDNGLDFREYSPIRITQELFTDRSNESLMLLSEDTINTIIDSVIEGAGPSKKFTPVPQQEPTQQQNACCVK